MRPRNTINPIDIYVGERLRLGRTIRGLSQQKLGKLAGVTFQQIQKYERGINPLRFSSLMNFAHLLEVPLNWFIAESATQDKKQNFENLLVGPNTVRPHEIQQLLQSYCKIADSRERRILRKIVTGMADQNGLPLADEN